MFRRFTIAVALAALAACQDDLTSPAAAPDTDAEAVSPNGQLFTLTLLHNNDGESALLPDGDIGGIARFASIVDELREQGETCDGPGRGRGRAPNRSCDVLLVSSGDNFLAGPEFNASLELPVTEPFFDAIALDALSYDAIAIGNHEFDFGPGVLADFIGDFTTSEAPFLSANLDVTPEAALSPLEAAGRIASSVVVETDGGPVGIVGATTERLPTISNPGDVIVWQDVAVAINAEVASLESEGVDQIILISHLQSLEEDKALIGALRDVDIVVAGGGDELLAPRGTRLLPGDERSDDYPIFVRDADNEAIPVVTTAGSYEYVGRLEVTFQRGRVLKVAKTSGPVPVVGGTPDPFLVAEVEVPVAMAVEALKANVIGSTDVTLDGTRQLVRTQETNYGNLIADSQLEIARALAPGFGITSVDVALQNGGGIRNSVVIDGGDPITEFDTFQTLPFSNFLTVVEGVTRERFKQVLENAVSRVEFTDGRFAQVAGVELEYDPDGQPQIIDIETGAITQGGSRVVNVTLTPEGGPDVPIVVNGVVQAGPSITIALANFLAAGGDQYPLADLPATNLGPTYQEVLETFIEDPAYLNGSVTGASYPAGGEGRVTTVN